MLHSNESRGTINQHTIAKALQMVEIDGITFPIEIENGNIRFNLTQMSKPFGREKSPGNWSRTSESRDYLDALSVTHICDTADLLEVRQGGIPANQGTWANQYLIAVEFARWLQPKFSIQVNHLVWKLLTKQAFVVESFMGVDPLIIEGVAHYYYRDVLKAVGLSTTSGTVYRRIKKYPTHFKKLYFRQFCNLQMCEYLKGEAEQKKRALRMQSNQLNLEL